MQDLTTGSITKHLLKATGFMLVMMAFQTLYFLIDLYWVGRIGTQAVAAVGVAGNLSWAVLALTQTLGVGTTAVISHAAGRKDRAAAQHAFSQSMSLSVASGAVFLVLALASVQAYARTMSADADTARMAAEYLYWFIPAMALQFPMTSMMSSLRAAGQFKLPVKVGTVTVLINMALAPFLIFGWGTGVAFGVAGAAVSTLIAVIVAVTWMVFYFRGASWLHIRFGEWRPVFPEWRRIAGIGAPAGFEFGVAAAYMALVYALTRPFGAAAQAGFGIGMRVVQAGFMPVVALGFSVAPVAGQNFGARLAGRVRATFKDAALLATAVMIVLGLLSYLAPAALVTAFTNDPAVITVGVEYLRIISWNYIASGIIFVASSTFQAMGNTIPSLIASAVRILLIAVPAIVLSRNPGFKLTWIWYLSMAAVWIQLGLALWFLRREFERRLTFPTPA
jgi:putative MATE family efflux protein